MYSGGAADHTGTLHSLLSPAPGADRFRTALHRLHTRFHIYAATCPEPLPAPGLIVTPEIRIQSELYLPIASVSAVFNRLYCAALTYPPILSSTPFHRAMSWADVFQSLPAQFQFSANPAYLLEALLSDSELMTEFLFASFLPRRFYGGFGRYPLQRRYIGKWLRGRSVPELRCLDIACGTGEDSYALANAVMEEGFDAAQVHIEGWTIEPLEVWAASHRRFPHDRQREALFRQQSAGIFERGYDACISFRTVDLLQAPLTAPFNLIMCNGLLGGPIINEPGILVQSVRRLSALLAPGGMLLAADSFHGGWKRQCPQTSLRALFEEYGLVSFEAGEGIGGLKPD